HWAAHRPRDDPRDDDEQQIQPEQTGHQAFSDQLGKSPLQIINAADEVCLETVLAADRTKIIHNIDTIFRATRLDHSQHEHCFLAIVGHKAFRHPRIFWLRHDLHHFFVADEKREWYAVALGEQSWQRSHSPNVFLMFKRA